MGSYGGRKRRRVNEREGNENKNDKEREKFQVALGVECDPTNKKIGGGGWGRSSKLDRRSRSAKPEGGLTLADHGVSLRLVGDSISSPILSL